MAGDLEIPTELDLAAFIGREAHDLKSPFNRILGFLKLVLKGMDGPIPDLARQDLAVAYQNSQYALVLVSGLVEAARLGQESYPMYPSELSMETLAAQAAADWKKQNHRPQAPEVLLVVQDFALQGDESLLRRCLVNWLNYVLEFFQEAGGLQLSVVADGDCWHASIRGQGSGPKEPSTCDSALYGFAARRILALHGGRLLRAAVDEQGAWVEFECPLKGSV